MGRALAVESDRVQRGNWSFRCETRDFEFLWPVAKMIAVQYLPNLAQLLRYRRDVEKLVQGHDEALGVLLSAANRAYEKVIESKTFRALSDSKEVAQSDRRYLAEYIVNGTRDLPSYYVHHEIWTREGGKFLDLRDDPASRSDFLSLTVSGRALAAAVERLQSAVGRLQTELADAYKLPPVDSVDVRA
jgi:hypothetical protein